MNIYRDTVRRFQVKCDNLSIDPGPMFRRCALAGMQSQLFSAKGGVSMRMGQPVVMAPDVPGARVAARLPTAPSGHAVPAARLATTVAKSSMPGWRGVEAMCGVSTTLG